MAAIHYVILHGFAIGAKISEGGVCMELTAKKFEELTVKQKIGMVTCGLVGTNHTEEGDEFVLKLIKERGQEEINVEMIIDIGNSRTSAILFENSDFTKVASLKLQNFSKPLLSNGKLNRVEDSFNMRLAFSKVEFGGNMEG